MLGCNKKKNGWMVAQTYLHGNNKSTVGVFVAAASRYVEWEGDYSYTGAEGDDQRGWWFIK